SNTGGSVAATCSPGSGEEASTATRCLTVGWGETGAAVKEELAARLQQAEISLLSHEDCANYWGQNIEETNMCGRPVGAAFCMDSGWPLICVVDGRYKLIGIASWGSDKCHPESPTVYTRVSAYRHWISSVTN
ncbi:CTRA protein, partial [Pygoscelis papua]